MPYNDLIKIRVWSSLFIILFIIGCAKQSEEIMGKAKTKLGKNEIFAGGKAPTLSPMVIPVSPEVWKEKEIPKFKEGPKLHMGPFGKLEYSKDKRGWDGKQNFDKEIIIETK